MQAEIINLLKQNQGKRTAILLFEKRRNALQNEIDKLKYEIEVNNITIDGYLSGVIVTEGKKESDQVENVS